MSNQQPTTEWRVMEPEEVIQAGDRICYYCDDTAAVYHFIGRTVDKAMEECARYAKEFRTTRPKPVKENGPATESVTPFPGDGWRFLEDGELIKDGDEIISIIDGKPAEKNWTRCEGSVGGNHRYEPNLTRRRRVEHEAPQAPAVYLAAHELAELRKANAELLVRYSELDNTNRNNVACYGMQVSGLQAEIDSKYKQNAEQIKRIAAIEAERDELAAKVKELEQYKDLYSHAIRCVDKVFQENDGDEPMLPGYVKLGQDKFNAVITLADEYNEVRAELAQLKAEPRSEVEEWRELEHGEQYQGPGQVRNRCEDIWEDAYIAHAVDDKCYTFVAKKNTSDDHSFYDQARVRKAVGE